MIKELELTSCYAFRQQSSSVKKVPKITTFKGYQYEHNSGGSYHRILNDAMYKALLEFYSNHIYLGGRFWDASILNRSYSELTSLVQYDLQKAKWQLNTLAHFGIPINHRSHLLELGCGCGAFLFSAEQEGFGICDGIDISTLAIPVCKRLWPKMLNISVGDILETLRNSPSKFGQYDVIAAFDFIEHIWDLQPVVQLIQILLKPHGLFVVEVPVISPHWSWKQVTNFCYFHPEHHLHLFTSAGIENLFLSNFTARHTTLSEDESKYIIVFEK